MAYEVEAKRDHRLRRARTVGVRNLRNLHHLLRDRPESGDLLGDGAGVALPPAAVSLRDGGGDAGLDAHARRRDGRGRPRHPQAASVRAEPRGFEHQRNRAPHDEFRRARPRLRHGRARGPRKDLCAQRRRPELRRRQLGERRGQRGRTKGRRGGREAQGVEGVEDAARDG